jgi:hypothetical protein
MRQLSPIWIMSLRIDTLLGAPSGRVLPSVLNQPDHLAS